MNPTDQQLATLDAARERRRAALAAADEALQELVKATNAEMHAELAICGDPHQFLLDVARSARAGWSGGPYGRSNLDEATRRDAALEASRSVRLPRG